MFTIENAKVLYGDQMEPVKANIVVEDKKIVEVSPQIKKGKIIDAKGCLIFPGLINSHVHLGDSVAMDMGDGMPIAELVKPPNGIKHRILSETSQPTIIKHMKQSLLEMLHTGTTTFMDFREGGINGIKLINKACEDIPLGKIIMGRCNSFLNPDFNNKKLINDAEELLSNCDGVAPSGLGEISDKTAQNLTSITKKLGKLSAIHAAEYEEVQKKSMESTGKTEVRRAVDAGFNILVHLTAPLEDDLDLISKKKIPVVCCPRSNGALSVGIPPIKELFEAGINIMLGTDNIMFNSPNILREMEYTLKVTRGYYKKPFPAREILKMATVNAGRALDLNSGTIVEGKNADLIVVDQISSNPYLSIINRTEPENIKSIIIEGKVVKNHL